MSAWIARLAKRFWHGSPFGKVVSALAIFIILASIGVLSLTLDKSFLGTIKGCSIDEEDMKGRLVVIFRDLELEYGQSKPLLDGSARKVFVQSHFDIEYVVKDEPCDSYFIIRVPIEGASASPLQPDRMLQALEDKNIGGQYKRGDGGSFVYDESAKAFYLSYVVPVRSTVYGDVSSTVANGHRIGAAWRKSWFEEVARIGVDDLPPR